MDDPRLDRADDPARAQAVVQQHLLAQNLPLTAPVPGVGFYVYCVNLADKWVQLDDDAGRAIQVNFGAEVQSSGWFVEEAGRVNDGTGDCFVRFRHRAHEADVTLYGRVLYPLTGMSIHMRWKSWLRHQDEPLAIRLRAQHKLIVIQKPGGEADDEDPSLR